ncbi:MAG: hypothetical protein LAE24_07885 [Candidatus Contendobacter sp.]|nr:hypothetical protein [Candidatus Contendobacter sp.]
MPLGDNPQEALLQLRALTAHFQPHQAILLSVNPLAGLEPYRILPLQLLARRLGEPETSRPTGIYNIDGRPTCARIKENFTPSRLILLDADPDPEAPEHLRDLTDEDRWNTLVNAVPEFSGAARLTIPSSSGRVFLPNGGRAFPESAGTHTYLVLARELLPEELSALRIRLEVRLWAAGLGYIKPSATGASLRRTLFDTSVLSVGREVFAGPPAVEAPLVLAPLVAHQIPGGCAALLPESDATERAAFSAQTGATVTGRGSAIEDRSTLALTTPIETEIGVLTVAQFLTSDRPKLRCQATFRESTSWAGVLRRLAGGRVLLHDVGTSTSYYYAAPAPLRAVIPGHLDQALLLLATVEDHQAQAVAQQVAARHAWRVPVKMAAGELADRIAAAHDAVNRGEIVDLLCRFEQRAREKALAGVSLVGVENIPGVRYLQATDPEQIRHAIADQGGTHFIKAPHGFGKTEHILRPLALASAACVAISNRVSLVADLAHRLQMDSYQAPSVENPPSLAICINSIGNDRFAGTLNAAELVLIDEGSRTARDCHDRRGTMKKNGQHIWNRLKQLVANAPTAVIADADLSTSDVALYQAALPPGTPITVWENLETTHDWRSTFGDEAQVLAQLPLEVENNRRPMLITDSANAVKKLAAAVRARFPDKRVVEIHAAPGTATTGRADVQALLANINGNVEDIDVLICSPAIESGLSLIVPHFTCHLALYYGVVEPAQFNQALRRDRTAQSWMIGICGPGVRSLPDDGEQLVNALTATAQRMEDIDGSRQSSWNEATPLSRFDRDCCEIEAAGNRARNAYAANLWHLLTARGWCCERADQTTDVQRQTAKAFKGIGAKHIAEELVIRILTAPDRTLEEVETLRRRHDPDPATVAMIARRGVREATGVQSGPLDRWHVELWQQGKLHSQTHLFNLLIRSGALALSARDQSDSDTELTLALRSHDAPVADALGALLTELGLDRETGAGETTANVVLAAWHHLADSAQGQVLVWKCLTTPFTHEPVRPISWLSRILNRLGLRLEQVRHAGAGGSEGRVYAIAQSACMAADEAVKTPGWALMAALGGAPRGVTVPARRSPLLATVTDLEARLRAASAHLDEIGETDEYRRMEALRAELHMEYRAAA